MFGTGGVTVKINCDPLFTEVGLLNPRHTVKCNCTHQGYKPQIDLLLENSINKIHAESATKLEKAKSSDMETNLCYNH